MRIDKYIFNLPNILSLSRIFVLPFVLNLIKDGTKPMLLLLLLLFICLTDFFDGYLSRKLKVVSDFGRTLDPFSDMIVLIAIAIMICTYRNFPQWAMYLIIARQILVMLGGIFIYQKKHEVAMSNLLGKFMALFWARVNPHKTVPSIRSTTKNPLPLRSQSPGSEQSEGL